MSFTPGGTPIQADEASPEGANVGPLPEDPVLAEFTERVEPIYENV